MAQVENCKRPLQQGVQSTMVDYYDIMVIGKTGMGKTTTVDKMIIADPEAAEQPGTSLHEKPAPDKENHKLVCKNFTMWMVSEKPFCDEPDLYSDNFARCSTRLEKLALCRSSENPHEKINNLRKEDPTHQCELFSNELTKVRVLDVPGFFGQEKCGEMQSIDRRLSSTKNSALSNMRKVLRIKAAHNLQIRRVVYFLPEKGVLTRTDQHLILELQIMEKHFGRAIFDNMVVIATESSSAYRHATPASIMYTEEDFSETKHHLQEALCTVFENKEDVPEPPIEFISLFDTCEDILRKIQQAPVREDRLNLAFKKSFCARCGLFTIKEGKAFQGVAYCTSLYDHLGPIPLKESLCHPIMVPKYSKIRRIIGGILHLVSNGVAGSWPNFGNTDEECIKCKKPPGSPGCMKIDTCYSGAIGDDTIKIKHSSSPVEPYNIQPEPEQVQPEQVEQVQPEQVQQDPVQSEQVHPEATEPDLVQPKQVQLEQVEQVQPEQVRPDPEQVKPEETQPEQVQPERVQPEPVQPEQVQLEATQSDPIQPKTTQPEPVQPEQVQPKPVQPETIKMPSAERRDGASIEVEPNFASPGSRVQDQDNCFDVKG